MKQLRNSVLVVLITLCYFPLFSGSLSTPPPEETPIPPPEVYQEDIAQLMCPPWASKCKGTKKYNDGSQYTGYFRFGKPHGKGTYTWADGSKYTGSFFAGRQEGMGKFQFANGNVYEGEFQKGQIEGNGTFTWVEGHEYVGNFSEGIMDGEGAMYFSNGESYTGMWQEGETHGYGEFTRLDGSKFIGNTSAGQRQGQGMIAWETGDTLRASWDNNKMNGQSVFTFDTGDQMINEWKDGKLALENTTYLTYDGEKIAGTLGEIEEEILLMDREALLDYQENLSLGLFSFAVEYKTSDQYEEAMAYLNLAQAYTPYSSRFLQMIVFQLKDIETKKVEGGWARLDK